MNKWWWFPIGGIVLVAVAMGAWAEMSKWWLIGGLIVLSVAVAAWAEIVRGQHLRPLLSRPCAGIRWRRGFSDASPNDIREFLRAFAECFTLTRKHRVVFRPDDRIMDIYLAFNPPPCTIGDNMELEELAIQMENHYGINLKDVWHDQITLGELFARTRES
jgi:hypothetical protein